MTLGLLGALGHAATHPQARAYPAPTDLPPPPTSRPHMGAAEVRPQRLAGNRVGHSSARRVQIVAEACGGRHRLALGAVQMVQEGDQTGHDRAHAVAGQGRVAMVEVQWRSWWRSKRSGGGPGGPSGGPRGGGGGPCGTPVRRSKGSLHDVHGVRGLWPSPIHCTRVSVLQMAVA